MSTAASVASAVSPQRMPSTLSHAVFYGVFGLLLFGPLAFGAVEPWAIFLLETGTAVLFVLWAVQQAQRGELQIIGNPLFLPMAVFGALIVVQLATGLTAYRYETFSSMRLYCAYGMLCFLVVQCLCRTSQVRTLALVLSVYGFALATFALVQGISSNGKLYWLRTPRFGGWIYGPYVNHNHYAGLMEMLIPIPLVIAFTHHVRGQRKKMCVAAAAVMASSIFLSGSRGGMAAFAMQTVILGVFVLRRGKAGKASMAIALFVAIVIGLLAWLGGSQLTKRLASIHEDTRVELSGGTRLEMDRDGLKMFAKKPALGWGLGVFPDVYPQFRSFYTNFFINAAHDDYIQLLVEMGALGFATMLWFVVVMYRSGIKKVSNWTTDTNSTVALAAMLGCTGILVHSLVDFNLQIPANAALFYVMCVVAAMHPSFGSSRRRTPHRQEVTELSA